MNAQRVPPRTHLPCQCAVHPQVISGLAHPHPPGSLVGARWAALARACVAYVRPGDLPELLLVPVLTALCARIVALATGPAPCSSSSSSPSFPAATALGDGETADLLALLGVATAVFRRALFPGEQPRDFSGTWGAALAGAAAEAPQVAPPVFLLGLAAHESVTLPERNDYLACA